MDDLAKHFIEEEPRRRIGDVLDVEVAVTRGWWVQPLGMVLGGQLRGRLFGSTTHRRRSGLGFTAGMAAAGMVHAPMDMLLVTPMRTFTLYDDTGETITPDQHRGRAIGGPAANLAAGFGAFFLSLFVKNRYLRFFAVASTFVGLGSLAPFGGNDGEALFPSKR